MADWTRDSYAGVRVRYRITIENSSEDYPCPDNQTLLRGMECLGRRGIPVGCRGGGCGVCKIRVTSGTYLKKKMNRAIISAVEEADHVVLACRCTPTSDLSLSVLGKMERALCDSRVQTHRAASDPSPSADRSVTRTQ